MLALPAELAAVLAGSHTACARLRVLAPDRSVLAQWEAGSSVILSGSVTFDRSQATRRSGSVELADPRGELVPRDASSLLATGALVSLERGAVVDGQRVFALLALLRVARFNTTMEGRLSLTLEDVLAVLEQPFGDAVTVPDGTPAADMIRALWGPVLGDTSGWSLDDGGRTTAARTFLEDENRLSAVAQLVRDLGLEVFADRAGQVVLRPIPDPMATPTARRFEQGPGTALLLTLGRSGERQPYNRAVVIGELVDGATIRAVADVTEPDSPIHASRIGLRVAPIHRSAQIPDQAAANAVARALVVQNSLTQDAVGATSVPAIELDEDDVIEAAERITATESRYRVERITHPVADSDTSFDATRVVPVLVAEA